MKQVIVRPGAAADIEDAYQAKAGGIDVALNAVGILHVQGTPLADLSFEEYSHPITAYTRAHFLTAKAVARHMVKQGSGVILTLSTPGSRMSGAGFLGYGVTCGAIETFSRILAGSPSGADPVILVVGHAADKCIRAPADLMDKITARTNGTREQVVMVTGGPGLPGPPSVSACEGGAPHGSVEQEAEVVAGIARFIGAGKYWA